MMGTLKNSRNFESAENVRSSNVVEFECELRHILFVGVVCFYVVTCLQLDILVPVKQFIEKLGFWF